MQHRNRLPAPRRRKTLALALSLTLFGASAAQADRDDRAATPEELARVRSALESKGYDDVHDLEVDDGRFEVDARNPRGEKVDLELDLTSLEILYEDRD
jgi:hypothetical protein